MMNYKINQSLNKSYVLVVNKDYVTFKLKYYFYIVFVVSKTRYAFNTVNIRTGIIQHFP